MASLWLSRGRNIRQHSHKPYFEAKSFPSFGVQGTALNQLLVKFHSLKTWTQQGFHRLCQLSHMPSLLSHRLSSVLNPRQIALNYTLLVSSLRQTTFLEDITITYWHYKCLSYNPLVANEGEIDGLNEGINTLFHQTRPYFS